MLPPLPTFLVAGVILTQVKNLPQCGSASVLDVTKIILCFFCNRFLLDKNSLKTLCYSSVHHWWHWWNLDFLESHEFIDLSVVPLTPRQKSGWHLWCQGKKSLESENWWTPPVLNKSNECPPQTYPSCLAKIQWSNKPKISRYFWKYCS